MSVLDEIAEVAVTIVVFFLFGIFVVAGVLAALLVPFLGVALSFVNPWIGVPVTVVLSLVSLAFLLLFAYWVIDEVRWS